MTELEKIRKEIDKTDGEMAVLFERRLALSLKALAEKEKSGLPLEDKKREEEMLKSAGGRVPAELRDLYTEFLKKNIELSKKHQQAAKGGKCI